MTNEDAIDYFKKSYANGNNNDERYHNEVLAFAIKALEERPKGKWKETGYETGALGITFRQT